MAPRPVARTSLATINAKSAGKSARYAIRTPAQNTAIGMANPPNVTIVSTSQ